MLKRPDNCPSGQVPLSPWKGGWKQRMVATIQWFLWLSREMDRRLQADAGCSERGAGQALTPPDHRSEGRRRCPNQSAMSFSSLAAGKEASFWLGAWRNRG